MAAFKQREPKINFHATEMQESACSEGRLLPQQLEALIAIRKYFGEDQRIGVVSMPTGSGKTGIMCCLPYFIAGVCQFDKPILVIAPDLVITGQIEQEMLGVTSENRLVKLPFLKRRGIVPEDEHDVLPAGRKIDETKDLINEHVIRSPDLIIANAQKFLGEGWRNALPDDTFSLVMVDEAHHHPAKTWRDIVDKFKGHAFVVFFTATPYRADRQPVLDPLPLVHHLSLKDAIQRRIIRKTDFEEVAGTDLLEGFELRNPKDKDKLENIAVILHRVRELQASKDGETPLPECVPHMAMVIAKNTTDAENIVRLWKHLFPNEPASAYHSEMKAHELKKKMEKIQRNQLKLVVVVAMLLEGFDHPPVSVLGVATKISSPVKFVQFIGRAQRLCRDSQGNVENRKIVAHVISHEHFEQQRNYDRFTSEELIPEGEQ